MRVVRMDASVSLVMVSLLKDLVGADAGGADRPVALMVHRRRIDIYAADLAMLDLDRINGPHTLGDELRAVARMFAENEDRPLVALALEGLDLGTQIVRAKRAADHVGVRTAERAVEAIVSATAADVKRREEHNAVAVDVALELPGGLEDPLATLLVIRSQQDGRFLQRQGLFGHALGDDLGDHLGGRFVQEQTV